jgi:NADH-quinone oxidoreductase subunit A
LAELVLSVEPNAALAIHVALSAAIVAVVIGVAALLRERRAAPPRDAAYESGILPAAPPDRPLNAPYFMIAALFVVFDMAAAILFTWAVVAREVGWVGLGGAAVFILVLLAALLWLRLDGALDFAPKTPARR